MWTRDITIMKRNMEKVFLDTNVAAGFDLAKIPVLTPDEYLDREILL